MRKLLGGLAALMAVACSESGAPTDLANVETEVEALLQEWSDAISERRLDDFKALYSTRDGFAWVERGQIQYRSAAEIAAGIDEVVNGDTSIVNTVSAIDVAPLSPSTAAFSARVTSTVENPAFTFSFDGILTGVAVKDGSDWKLYRGHLSDAPA